MDCIFSNNLTDNIDVLSCICSFMNRKRKFEIREVNRDFYNSVLPRSMVTLNFYQTPTLESPYFQKWITKCLAVNKMIIEDLKVYGKFISFEIGKKLQQTPNFCKRLEHLEFKQLKFFNKNVTENPEK